MPVEGTGTGSCERMHGETAKTAAATEPRLKIRPIDVTRRGVATILDGGWIEPAQGPSLLKADGGSAGPGGDRGCARGVGGRESGL